MTDPRPRRLSPRSGLRLAVLLGALAASNLTLDLRPASTAPAPRPTTALHG